MRGGHVSAGVLVDIDGTLLDGGGAIEGAAEAMAGLRRRGVRLLFATNTSRKSRADVAASLRAAGIEAREEEVLSASYAAAELLRAAGVRRAQLLVSPRALADFAGIQEVRPANPDSGAPQAAPPEAVVVGDMGSGFTFEVLNAAFLSLRAGARFIATHKGRAWLSERGWALDAGAFVAALEFAAEVAAETAGKPSPAFFRMAARILGTEPSSMIMVGDDLEADIAGGRAAGMKTILVRTGKFDARRLAELPPGAAPHQVINSVRDLPRILDS